MSRRGKGGIVRKTEINMIPFLDVLLTMLLIFMIATPAVNRAIDVQLPPAEVSKVTEDPQEKDIVVVEVHTDDSYTIFYNLEKYADLREDLAVKQLDRIFTEIVENNRIKDTIVQVAADENAPYRSVVKAIDILKKYSVIDVGLITRGLDEH